MKILKDLFPLVLLVLLFSSIVIYGAISDHKRSIERANTEIRVTLTCDNQIHLERICTKSYWNGIQTTDYTPYAQICGITISLPIEQTCYVEEELL